jgi:hypothetical protein
MNLTTSYSLWLAPLCLALGIAAAWWLYRRSEGREAFSRNLSLLLAGLRALVIAVVAFFLLEPMVRVLVREVRRPVVVIAHDGSASLGAAGDTAALRNAYRSKLEELAERLGDKYDVRTFTYGAEVREGLHFEQGDVLTDIGEMLRTVQDRLGGPDLGAVIMDGDGIHNRGRDPLLEATRLGIPVHTIAMGDTTVRPDLLLRAVEHNRINYLGNEFPLLARVEARHLKGTRTKVSVSQGGVELASREVIVGSDPFFQEVPFTLKAERPGMQRFTVAVGTVAGEATEVNNTQDINIDVLDARQKVLLLGASPHPDLGALRNALSGLDGYETELAYAKDPGVAVESFDLIVLHRLPSVEWTLAPLLQRASAKGIPLLVIMGQGTDPNAFNALGCGVQVTGARAAVVDAQASVVKTFSAFTIEPEMVNAIERFPPLQVPFGQYDLGRAAVAMITQRIGVVRTDYPLIAMVQQNERRMATILGEGLWRWRLADQQQNGSHERIDRLVHKLVQFLALKVDKKRFRVEHASAFNAGESVLFSAELYNQAYELVNDPEVELTLTDEAGRDFPYVFGRTTNAYRADAGRLPAGRYTWKANTVLDGERYTASGEVLVQPVIAELISTVADHGLMADIAVRTGGVAVQADGLDALEEAIRQRPEIAARSYAHASFSDLISLKWIFFALLVLLSAEWVLRRRNGAY